MKKIVSPFEFAITQIVDPEKAKYMRPETLSERTKRIEKHLRDIMYRVKTK